MCMQLFSSFRELCQTHRATEVQHRYSLYNFIIQCNNNVCSTLSAVFTAAGTLSSPCFHQSTAEQRALNSPLGTRRRRRPDRRLQAAACAADVAVDNDDDDVGGGGRGRTETPRRAVQQQRRKTSTSIRLFPGTGRTCLRHLRRLRCSKPPASRRRSSLRRRIRPARRRSRKASRDTRQTWRRTLPPPLSCSRGRSEGAGRHGKDRQMCQRTGEGMAAEKPAPSRTTVWPLTTPSADRHLRDDGTEGDHRRRRRHSLPPPRTTPRYHHHPPPSRPTSAPRR